MIKKVLIPLEDVQFRGIDNKVRLRYRLVSKDKNETSQWSPIYTVYPYEIKSAAAGYPGPGSETTNPILYSEWEPTSYSDGKNINIKIDSGWVKDKHVIPCNNFDVFISWNQFPYPTAKFWGYEVSKDGTIVAGTIENSYYTVGPFETIEVSSATITDVPTKNLQVGDAITINPVAPAQLGSGYPASFTTITKIYSPYSMQITTETINIPDPIVAGSFTSLSKFRVAEDPDIEPVTDDFVYAGTTNSGNISIQIPNQAFSEEKATQYQYILTPARNSPGILETLDQYGWDYTNEIYRSSILTTEATVEPGATSNTYNIDSGSPT
jgi:hypothetical protein